jgi:ankyrin repeat protein
MLKKIIFILAFTLTYLDGSDILQLVALLDRNDTSTFKSDVKTIQDANALREDNNKTILMYAVWVGNDEIVKYLIDKGADVNAQDTGGASALHLAAWKGYTQIAVYLLENGASAQAMSIDGMTPLDIAKMKGNQELITAIDKSAPKLKPLL